MYGTTQEDAARSVGVIPPPTDLDVQRLILFLDNQIKKVYNKDTKEERKCSKVKLTNANAIRARIVRALGIYFDQVGEDVDLIASNTLNFPVVAEDGEEGWVEVVVKVPKGTKDEEYDGYGRRQQYELELQEKAEKKAKADEAKAKKIAKDKAKREKAE